MTNPVHARRLLLSGSRGLAYDPFALSGLLLYLPNGDWVLTGSNASQWNDRSGNGFSPTQGTGANQPTQIQGAANGLPVLRGDGTDFLSFGASARAMFNNLSGATIIFVGRWNGSASNNTAFYFSDNTGATSTRISLNRSATVNRGVFRNTDGGAAATATGGAYDSTRYDVMSYVLDPNNGSGSYVGRQNGTQVYTAAPPAAGIFPNTTSNTARLFNNGDATGAMQGDLGLVLVYNRVLPATELQYLERGIGQQFGTLVA